LKVFKQSDVDPDAGLFWKNERERMMCYSINAACDRYGFILGSHVSSGNMHDSKNYQPLLLDVIKRFPGEVKLLAADAGYIAPHIAKLTSDNNIRICLPYKRPMTKKGYFKKYEYVYDEFYDVYICPNEKLLTYTTTNRAGKNIYKSNPDECINCSMREQCTHSKDHRKVIERDIWQRYLDEANHQRHTKLNKKVYKLRSETIERRFGDAKEKHGMRYTKYRGLQKNADHTMLIFACMNLKKMVNQIAG